MVFTYMKKKNKKIELAVGILVHNEEKNIGALLKSLTMQQLERVVITEIIVVSSGSNDNTNKILRQWQKKHPSIRVVTELNRRGKSAAINTFLQSAKAPVLVAISGDLKLHTSAIEEIGILFFHDEVGMVGAHPVPTNTRYSSIGQEVKLLWELHHQLSLRQPKCGEMVAFRNIIHKIPPESAVDEATLEILLQIIGYKVVYAPAAVVYNKGPLNVSEFLTQRRRVYAGHEWVQYQYNYRVASMNTGELANVALEYLQVRPKQVWTMGRLVSLEILARMLGFIDYHVLGRNPYKWKMISR